jgi:dienelactone hydrolase
MDWSSYVLYNNPVNKTKTGGYLMRTFEVVLIFVNLLALFLSFKKQSKSFRLGVAGLNLSLLLIHGIFEGFRYQMAFSYIFVILLAVYTLVKTSKKLIEAKTPKVLKGIVISLCFIFLASTSFLAYTLPVFKLPKPTGIYDVGIKYFHLIDEKRNDPFLDRSPKKRELMVKVYYPAKKNNSKPYNHYFHNSPELIKLFAKFYNMPDFMFDHLNLIKTNSKDDLKISEKEQSYPVVLFSHGGGTTMEVQTSQSEDLASHGYIVVAIDHTYVSAATVFPDRTVWHREATTDFNTVEPAEIITQIMAEDSKFVIDKLEEMKVGKMDSIFKGKLNLEKIGAIGHSLGGAVAYNLAINDSRVKAAIDLDGRVFIAPEVEARNVAPFLMLANDRYHIQAIQNREGLLRKFEDMPVEEQRNALSMYGGKVAYNEAYNKAQQSILGLTGVLKASGNLYTIEGSDHMKFTDLGFFIGVRQLRELIGIGGKTDPAKCLDITKSVTTAFFNQHLKGETQEALESLGKKYPELKKVELH